MKKSSRVAAILIWAAVALTAVPALVSAEDDMQILLEKLRADKKLLVAQNMELTDSEAKAFWPVYGRYQDELFLLRARTAKMIQDYAQAYGNMTDDSARGLLDEYLTLEDLGLKLRRAYLAEFRKVLPEKKVARYYQIENKVQAAMMYELGRTIPLIKTGS